MSAPSDDFFGIQYISSTEQQSSSKTQDAPQRRDSPPSPSRVQEDVIPQERKVSGTEYLDNAFFPGLKERQEALAGKGATVADDLEGGNSEFESQYFRRISEEEAQGNRLHADRQSVELDDEEYTVPAPPLKQKSKKKQPKKERLVYAEEETEPSGLSEIRRSFLPVWHMNDEQLVDFVSQTVIYSDANLIAFDKPYGLAYSGGREGEQQFDRMLQKVKALVAPKVERLHLVRSLDKNQSGVVLFATNKLVQSEVKDMLNSDGAKLTHRCLVRRGSEKMPVNVTIPLVKKIGKDGMKLTPLLSNNMKGDIFYGETSLKVISENKNYVAYVEATTQKEAAHQLRCHLNLAGMPLIGDGKYGSNGGRPPRLSNVVLNQLGVSENQSRKIPAYSHLMRMEFPSPNAKQAANVRITAPLPHHFTWILRKLRLLKIRR